MKENHEGLAKILEILKQNPRGMSVTQITEKIGMNRITVGHYLEILRTSGEVDMETYGQSKVYFISQRMPISALMNLSSDYVIVLSNDLNIIQINNNAISLLQHRKEDIINKNIHDILDFLNTEIDLQQKIDQALDGEEVAEEIRILKDSEELFFKMKIIPTVFTNGAPGITIILEDITEYRKSIQALSESEQKFRELLKNISELLVKIEHIAELNDQIRNPLQVIIGIADLEDVEIANQIKEQAQEIDAIIRQLNIGNIEAENIRNFFKKYAETAEEDENQ
ncbi:PAS domain-containing protein [Methanogenium organophilum]|uniref:PAS domain-containing protein n=1 Tax=Methanogenium organophilum TaxID=2199 RepID=A0A9X9S3A0_METOG|nr:PAS domain-containing protein [Methanogenium organophilum]WAI00962.1 PAS domain-containing protein [Methanogenium organophilum]